MRSPQGALRQASRRLVFLGRGVKTPGFAIQDEPELCDWACSKNANVYQQTLPVFGRPNEF